jgi:ribosome maturation factor RimP
MEHKISDLIEKTVNSLGFDLVKVIVRGSATKIVEILIECKNGDKIQVGDCQIVSKNISALLDVENIISGKYFLEVSSAGIERPLVKPSDFHKFVGREIKIRLNTAHNGNLSFRGELLGFEEEKVKIKSKNISLSFDYGNIKSAKLVLTEEMFRAILNKK